MLIAVAGIAVLASCSEPPTSLEQIRRAGQLRVLTINQPTSYYLGSHGGEGLEYRLAEAFARRLGVQLVIRPVRNLGEARTELAAGGADLVAAQVTATPDWRRAGLSTGSYLELAQVVVQRRGAARPANVTDLRGKRLAVQADSPQLQMLRALQGNGADYLSWTELPREQADPLDWVSSGDADYAIVDANHFAFERYVYPDVVAAFTLPDQRLVQWIVRRDGLDLRDEANAFLTEAKASGAIARLERAAQAESRGFEYQEAVRFQEDVKSKLPALRPWFEKAAASTGVDWRLLAAVGYQESHWDPAAVSADDARGIMMLTESTADRVGVKDRSNPEQSILGGAVYLAEILATVPARVTEPDRTWLALAAYNVGFGHLEDARVLAEMYGRNADRWSEVRQYLPLLAQESWYLKAKRGYARGWEPVRFVEQVRGFLAVLQWYDTPLEELKLNYAPR